MIIRPILVPKTIEINISDRLINLQCKDIHESLNIEQYYQLVMENEKIYIEQLDNSKKGKLKTHSIYRRLINTIQGLIQPFMKQISVVGTGYFIRPIENRKLELELGYSHRIYIDIPTGINIETEGNNVKLFGHNKQQLGTFVSKLESLRYPNVYSGKGVIISGKQYVRKVRVKKKK